MAISYISQASVEATSITIPSHQAGDLLLIFAFVDASVTEPTLPAGWTSIATTTLASPACASRIGYKIATSGSETSGTWTGATGLVCQVYRGALGIGRSVTNTASSATVAYPALTLANTQATTPSWVAGFAGHRSVNGSLGTPPTGMTNRANLEGVTNDMAGHDTNGGVSSWSLQSVASGETASGYATALVEILPNDLYYIQNVSLSNVNVPSGVMGCYVTLIGGGGGGGGGAIRNGSTAPSGAGGGGGGGGAYIRRVFVPASALGSTYTVTRGTGGAGGSDQAISGDDGSASSFVSNGGAVTISAGGGSKGVTGQSGATGGAGGIANLGGFSAEVTETGGSGGTGAVASGTPATAASNTTHAGPGGGGGGGNIGGANPASSKGGDSSTATGGGGGGTNTAGTAGGDGAVGEGGGGGGGGGGGNGAGNNGYPGATGGTSGAGGGGGGGKEGFFNSGGPGGAGAAGYSLVEWVTYNDDMFIMF